MEDLNPVPDAERLVANIHTDEFKRLDKYTGDVFSSALAVDTSESPGRGFFIFKMEPNTTTEPHTHGHDEHFYVVEGDLTDHDGYEYHAGDIVMLRKGTRHCSSTKAGCVLVAYVED